jgi:hypothetical protein
LTKLVPYPNPIARCIKPYPFPLQPALGRPTVGALPKMRGKRS